MGKMVK
jgi:hypothetical protein